MSRLTRMACTPIKGMPGKERGRELWANPYLKEFEMKNGKHFNEKLSTYASRQMVNRDGSNHMWTHAEVKSAMTSAGMTIPAHARWCDAHYLANMFYADNYGSSAKTETDCLMRAYDFLNDPDGYEGRAFNHYLADLMECEKCDVPWKEML